MKTNLNCFKSSTSRSGGRRREENQSPAGRSGIETNELNPLINTPIHGGVGVRREGNRFKRFLFAVLRRGTPINGGVNETTPADGAVHCQAVRPMMEARTNPPPHVGGYWRQRFFAGITLALLFGIVGLHAQDTNAPVITNEVTQAEDLMSADASQTGDGAEEMTGTNTVSDTNQIAGPGPDGRARRLRRRAQNRPRDAQYNGARSGSTGTNASSPFDYAAFQMVADRNIFNPNRSPRSGPALAQPKTVESFTLVGTMSYEKGIFAFFDGTSSDFQKVLKPNDTIAGYKVVTISADSAKLMLNTNVVELTVGNQMRRRDDGGWERSTSSESYAASTTSSSAADAASNGAESDIIKKMMMRREKE